MSAYFKLLTIFVVFLCLYCHETDASKEWIRDRFNDAKKAINKRFNRETLNEFLNAGPKLWAEKTISQAQKLFFRKTLGSLTPSPVAMDSLENSFSEEEEEGDETVHNHAQVALPTNFDSRKQWPNCASIKEIQSQSQCGSCWAVSSAAAFSDRICIASNGTRKVKISSMDLLACCGECKAGGINGDGCQGGIVPYAYQHFVNKGIVSGGPFGDKTGCLPYKWPPTAESGFGAEFISPKCAPTCLNKVDYNKDKYYGANLKMIPKGDITSAMREIYTKGSIVVAFMVTEEFMAYNGGVYYKKNKNSPEMGGHAVRVIGWGEDNDVPYWLVANSWGPCWGEGGTVRFIRGRNEHGIEDWMTAGDINLSKSASG